MLGRKYRDEIRPRHGILRSREFVMKDLYTFDYSPGSALSTYDEVRSAYSRLFGELKVPYLVAEASSGDIGGDLSHEYHLPTSAGEDNVISCNACAYVANEELAISRLESSDRTLAEQKDGRLVCGKVNAVRVWRGVSKDRSLLVNVWYPETTPASDSREPVPTSDADLNIHAIKSIVPDLDSSLSDSAPFWTTTQRSSASEQPRQIVNVIDHRLGNSFTRVLRSANSNLPILPQHSDLSPSTVQHTYIDSLADDGAINILKIREGDRCPKCSSGSLKIQRAVELGHTFHLGARYSSPLGAHVQVPSSVHEDEDANQPATDKRLTPVPIQMGCHGIGVSRVVGAVADHLADEKGLNWPRVIAPFEVVVIPGRGTSEDAALVANILATNHPESALDFTQCLDVALDDRADSLHSLPWKMKDADLIGYPILVILGRKWASDLLCEVQCRRLGITGSYQSIGHLPLYIRELLAKL